MKTAYRIESPLARDLAKFLLKATVLLLAIVIGGVWLHRHFADADAAVPKIQLTISTEYQRISDGSRILYIHPKPMNIGRSTVEVNPNKSGFAVTVRKLSDSVGQGTPGSANLPKVLYKVDLMKLFPDGFLLEPGDEHDEVVALVVPKGSYSIKATLDLGGNNEIDQTVIVRVE